MAKVGRPSDPNSERSYAESIGIHRNTLKRLGGSTVVKAMSPELRALYTKAPKGDSRTVSDGGLRARGYRSRKPGMFRGIEVLR